MTSLMQYLRDKEENGSADGFINKQAFEMSKTKYGDPSEDYLSSVVNLEGGDIKSHSTTKTRLRKSV